MQDDKKQPPENPYLKQNQNQPVKPQDPAAPQSRQTMYQAGAASKALNDQNRDSSTGSGKWKAALGGVGVLGILAFKFLAGFGTGVVVSEAEIQASKFQPWGTEMKQSFFEGCKEEAAKAIGREAPAGTLPSQIEKLAGGYCNCITDKVESAHIIKTKYNTAIQTKETAEKEIADEIGRYIQTEDGQRIIKNCGNTAMAQTQDGMPN